MRRENFGFSETHHMQVLACCKILEVSETLGRSQDSLQFMQCGREAGHPRVF